jgi:hypothetical protein
MGSRMESSRLPFSVLIGVIPGTPISRLEFPGSLH